MDILSDHMNNVKESREREAKKAGVEVEEVEMVEEDEVPSWKVKLKDLIWTGVFVPFDECIAHFCRF